MLKKNRKVKKSTYTGFDPEIEPWIKLARLIDIAVQSIEIRIKPLICLFNRIISIFNLLHIATYFVYTYIYNKPPTKLQYPLDDTLSYIKEIVFQPKLLL